MNGHREKQEAELTWSAIKRAVTFRVNYEAQVWRERRLNKLLAEEWKRFTKQLNRGELPDAKLDELGPGRKS